MNTSHHNHHIIITARPRLHRLARSVARRTSGRLREDDAVGIADLALCQAARRFQSNTGAQFTTFAYPWVWGALMRALKKHERHQHDELLPERVVQTPTCALPPAPPDVTATSRALMQAMSDTQRWLAIAHGVGGLSLAEASASVGKSRTWGHRQWQRLRHEYRTSGDVDGPD